MRYGHGRTLTIVTDCHSSGNWVNRGKTFLHSHGIPICGHLAKEKGILLRIYASCRTGQDAIDLRYITRGITFKDGRMDAYTDRDIGAKQKTFGADFTTPNCEKYKEENGIQLSGRARMFN